MQKDNQKRNQEEVQSENNDISENENDNSTQNLTGDTDTHSEITGGEFEGGRASDEQDFDDVNKKKKDSQN